MGKVDFKPGTMVNPLPAVLVSCADKEGNSNLITIAWTGTICSDPPMCYISVRPGRYSYPMIKDSGEFVINITTTAMAKATDWCGCRSGRDYDKWKESGLTKGNAKVVNVPVVQESPLNIECKVKDIIQLGAHDMFIAEVVHVQASDDKTGKFNLAASQPIVYNHGGYYNLGKKIGKFGWSVEKKKTKKKRNKNR